MTERTNDPALLDAVELLARYSFDLGAFAAEQLVEYWLRRYPANWIRTAVIEALYQGRYKAVSVGQILAIWGRRGHPIYHFNSEFERIVSNRYLILHPTKPDAPSEDGVALEADVPEESPAEQPPPTSPTPTGILLPELPEPEPPLPQPEASLLPLEFHAHAGSPEIWARGNVTKYPIHRFVPDPEGSLFYIKLWAVAHDEAFPETAVSLSTLITGHRYPL